MKQNLALILLLAVIFIAGRESKDAMALDGGTYNPVLTVTGATNVLTRQNSSHYIVAGNQVHVNGSAEMNVGKGTEVIIRVKFPINTVITNSWDCSGFVYSTDGVANIVNQVTGDTVNDAALMSWTPGVTGGIIVRWQFTYTVAP